MRGRVPTQTQPRRHRRRERGGGRGDEHERTAAADGAGSAPAIGEGAEGQRGGESGGVLSGLGDASRGIAAAERKDEGDEDGAVPGRVGGAREDLD